MGEKKKGLFLAFEGIDGSGKSTQIRLLYKKLREQGMEVISTCEPTDRPIGTMIRQILTGKMQADSRVIAALFAADRLDHLLNEKEGIAAALKNGITVLTDRYYFSSYAYHSVDVPMEWVIAANEESAKICRPDLTIYIDIDAERAMDRITRNRSSRELFEKQSLLEQVRDNYFKAFKRFEGEERILIVDGNQSMEAIHEKIWEEISSLILI